MQLSNGLLDSNTCPALSLHASTSRYGPQQTEIAMLTHGYRPKVPRWSWLRSRHQLVGPPGRVYRVGGRRQCPAVTSFRFPGLVWFGLVWFGLVLVSAVRLCSGQYTPPPHTPPPLFIQSNNNSICTQGMNWTQVPPLMPEGLGIFSECRSSNETATGQQQGS